MSRGPQSVVANIDIGFQCLVFYCSFHFYFLVSIYSLCFGCGSWSGLVLLQIDRELQLLNLNKSTPESRVQSLENPPCFLLLFVVNVDEDVDVNLL